MPIPGVRWREQNTTVITYLFLDPELNLVERNEAAHQYADSLPPPTGGATRGSPAPGPARLAQFEAIDDVLPWIEVATIAVILIVVALYFRSLGAPLVTLACAGLAYVIAVRVLAWSGERAGVVAPSEIEPVLVVLLLGLVTDYTVFFMSETRRRLLAGDARLPAARAATARIAPLVLLAGRAGGRRRAVAAGRRDAVLPRLRARAGALGARGDAGVRDARAGAAGAARAVAVRPRVRAADRGAAGGRP